MTPTKSLSEFPVESDAARTLVDRLFRVGAEAHPTVRLERDGFSRGAIERAGWTAADNGGTEIDALSAMDLRGRSPDLYLVMACDTGRDGAWDRLCATCLPAVARSLTAQGIPHVEADAIASELPGHLIQPPRHGRTRTRLGGYRGASSLTTFLAVAALALRTNQRRERPIASLEQLGPPGSDPGIASDAPPLALRLADAEAAAQLKVALPAAWARLTRQESLALLFKCRDDLPQRTIATMLGVGAPRVSRLIDSAHARLRAGLASASMRDGGVAQASRAVLRGVIENFLATSFPDLRPGGGLRALAAAADPSR